MYAIIDDSGTQFKVTTGDKIRIDRPMEQHDSLVEGKTLKFDRVLLVGGDGAAKIGQPMLAGASVTAEVIRSLRDKKVYAEKYNRRKRYHRRKGHRQNYLEVTVTAISA